MTRKTEADRLIEMIDAFAERMKEKVLDKLAEGFSGWSQKSYRKTLESDLVEHAFRGIRGESDQWLDVANLAAFLDYQATMAKAALEEKP